MYRQIRVDSRDLPFQNILWKPDLHAPVIEFELLTVTYGMTCAPFLALRVMQQLAIDEGSHFPLAAPILRENTYVDDVLFGDDDIEHLQRTRNQLIDLLSHGGFELRKWASNSIYILANINPDNHGLACSKNLVPDETLKVLSITWNPHTDSFHFVVNLLSEEPVTKRAILSTISRLYDPLGWVVPVIISAKIIIQHLWRAKVGWDDDVPEPILTRWRQI